MVIDSYPKKDEKKRYHHSTQLSKKVIRQIV